MLWLLVNNLDFEKAKAECVTKRFPFLEYISLMPKAVRNNFPNNVDITEKLPSPRLIKSHLPPALLPKQLWTVKPKIIYVSRNPKDTATSFFYHNRLMYDLKMCLDEFLEAFLENVVHFTPYWGNVLEFWKLRNEPNILWNTYEEMKKDLGGVIRKTAAFLGTSVSEEQIRQLEEHLSFNSMRDNPATNYNALVHKVRESLGLPPPSNGNTFMRRGEVGDAKLRMSEEMSRRFDRWTQDNIQGTDYDGPI